MPTPLDTCIALIKAKKYLDVTNEFRKNHNKTIDDVLICLEKEQPVKPVIPDYIDDFLKKGSLQNQLTYLIHHKQLGVLTNMPEGPVKEWLRQINQNELLDVWNGYDVEPEIGEVTIHRPGELPFKTTLPISEIIKLFPVLDPKNA